MKTSDFQSLNLQVRLDTIHQNDIFNKPGRKSNPIPSRPDEEEEEPLKPGKEDPSKKKKKKSIYEVTY